MNPSDFDELGIDAMTGADIMSLLGLTSYQLQDPIIFNRVSDVVGFIKDIPDKAFFINRITVGKNVDKLNHVWSYIEVLKKKQETEKNLSETDRQLNSFGEKESLGQMTDFERSLAVETVNKKMSLSQDLSRIKEEEMIYSK